jgi:hypothetical protein
MRRAGLGVVLACAALAACGREHLRANHGVRSRQAFGVQRIAREPAAAAPSGLDSEEAAIIHERYRQSLGAPADEPDRGARVLVVEEPKDAPRR